MPNEIVEKSLFEATLRSRYQELRQHTKSGTGPSEEPEVGIRACFRSAADIAALPGETKPTSGRAQFDLWWTNCPSSGMHVLLWDRWEVEGLSRGEYEGLLDTANGMGLPMAEVLDDKKWLGEVVPLRPHLTWKYHPERFKGVMPFAGRVAQIGREHKGNLDTDAMNALAEARFEAEEDCADRPLRARVYSPSRNSRRLTRIVELLVFHAAFAAHSRQIFDIPPQLGEMFRRTDVDDITAESIKVPYPGIYLHFGPKPDLAFDLEWTPEGAYVQELGSEVDGDRVLQFCVTFAPSDLEKYRDFEVNIEPVYVQSFDRQHMRMPLGDAVDLVLSEKMARLRKEAQASTMPGLEDKEVQELAASHGITIASAQADRARQELSSLEPEHKCYLEMLKLIVNSLAYLTAYPKDVETKWPGNTPPTLLKELGKTDNRNEQRRIQSKLAAMGFTPVHLCGRRLAEELESSMASSQGQEQRAVHWRRGHWRRQPHGPQNSLRKLVWLMPTLVIPGGSQAEPLGHLYLVT
jgi:hypothetical protein